MTKIKPTVIKLLIASLLMIFGCLLLSTIFKLTSLYLSWLTYNGLRIGEIGRKYAEIIYFVLFIIVPLIVVISLICFSRKNKYKRIIRTYLIVLMTSTFIVVLLSPVLSERRYKTEDFDTYLTYGTEIELLASKILPSKDELKNADIISYEFSCGSERVEFIKLKVSYDDEHFDQAEKAVKEVYCLRDDIEYGDEMSCFYIDNQLYVYYSLFDNDERYPYHHTQAGVFVYSIDKSEKTIMYIMYDSAWFSVDQTEDMVKYYLY